MIFLENVLEERSREDFKLVKSFLILIHEKNLSFSMFHFKNRRKEKAISSQENVCCRCLLHHNLDSNGKKFSGTHARIVSLTRKHILIKINTFYSLVSTRGLRSSKVYGLIVLFAKN